MAEGRSESLRRRQARLAAEQRSAGKTWVEAAEIFQTTFRLNPRVALRLVRGWSQAQAADEWNRRWPDQPKTFKNFSHWEIWPGKGGYSPSHDNHRPGPHPTPVLSSSDSEPRRWWCPRMASGWQWPDEPDSQAVNHRPEVES